MRSAIARGIGVKAIKILDVSVCGPILPVTTSFEAVSVVGERARRLDLDSGLAAVFSSEIWRMSLRSGRCRWAAGSFF